MSYGISTLDNAVISYNQNLQPHISMLLIPYSYMIRIKTHGCVSAAKEDVWHTSLLFTGTAKSPFSTPHISITTGSISIKFTYFMPCMYTTLHTKFEENRLSSL